MANTVQINELAEAIQNELEMYSEEVNENLMYAADIVSKQLVEDIREDSPSSEKGNYKKNWTRRRNNHSYIVYNKKYGWLTHLLEFGHLLRNGKRLNGKPHILKNAKRAAETYEDMAVGVISEGVRYK